MYYKLIFTLALTWVICHTASADDGTVDTLKYYSTTQNDSCNMLIYLPAGYTDEGNTDHYPVFYLMHGAGEDYSYWIRAGFADTVLNYYIANEIAVPMILVTPDGRTLAPEIFNNEMMNDIIPYIESNYRVIADKDHRGMGGLSWGGQQTLVLGIPHYELFGYLAVLSSGYFSDSYYNEADAFLATNAADVEESLRYFYLGEGTKYDLAYDYGIRALEMFRDYGLTVHYWEYSGGHQWTVWKEDFKSFTPFLFRDSTVRYVSLAFQGGIIKNSTIMTYRDSLAPAPQDPARTGYTFAGWFTEPEYVDSFDFSMDTIRHNITVYAKWDINSYKVSFNSNGGNYTPDTIITNYNTYIEEPVEPEKTGLYFGGWYSDVELTNQWLFDMSKVTRDTTLYAKWNDFTSIGSGQNTAVFIYPNPAQNYLQIGNLQSKAAIDIYNIEGSLLIHDDNIGSNGMVDLENIPQGIYTLVVQSNNENYRFKFVKQ